MDDPELARAPVELPDGAAHPVAADRKRHSETTAGRGDTATGRITPRYGSRRTLRLPPQRTPPAADPAPIRIRGPSRYPLSTKEVQRKKVESPSRPRASTQSAIRSPAGGRRSRRPPFRRAVPAGGRRSKPLPRFLSVGDAWFGSKSRRSPRGPAPGSSCRGRRCIRAPAAAPRGCPRPPGRSGWRRPRK